MKKEIDNSRSISSIIKGSMSNIVIGAFIFLALICLVVEYISIIKIVENSMDIETKVASERIEWAITSYKNIAEDIGTIPELSDPKVSVRRKQELLDSKAEEYGLVRCKTINLDGYSDFDGEYRGDRVYFNRALHGETCIVDPIVAKTDGQLAVIVAAPLWANGTYGSEIKGVVFCSIKPEILSNIVSEMEITKNTNVYVLGKTGTVVASTNLYDVSNRVNHIQKAKEDFYYKKLAEIDSAVLRGEEGIITSWEGALGGKIYAIHGIEETPDWHLVIHTPLKDYLRPLWIALGIYVFVIFVLILILNQRSKAVANQIGNPFKEIADRLKRAAEGDLSTEVLTFGDTEEIRVISNAARDLVNRLDYMTTDDDRFETRMLLKNLIDSDILQVIQEMVMASTGLGIIVIDSEGNRLATSSNATRFCGEYTKKSLVGCEKCEACDRQAAMECIEKGECISYFCHAGLKEYAAPIMMEGHYLGAILGGQIRVDDIDEEKIRRLANEYDINPDEYVEAAKEIKLWTKEELDKVDEALNHASILLSNMARQAYMNNIKNRKQEKRAILQNVKSGVSDSGISSLVKKMSGINPLDLMRPDVASVEKALFDGATEELFESVYSPRDVVEDAIGDIELRTKGRNIDFLLEIKENLPSRFMGDEDKVSNIVNRMVQTAISSTDSGYIRMDVSSVKSGYVTYLKLKIRYSGGNKDAIDKERMKRFFDRRNSFSLENHNAQEIGLITLSNVIFEINGQVEIKDNRGQGVTICVVIPQLEAEEEAY